MNKALDLLKQNLNQVILFTAKFENISLTNSQISMVLNHQSSVDEYSEQVILNINKAYQFIIKNVEQGKTFELTNQSLKAINKIVGDGLIFYNGINRISATGITTFTKHVEIPRFDGENFSKNLEIINQSKEILDRVTEFIIYAIVSQPFDDGNKRTTFITANAYLISHNYGLIILDDNDFHTFNELLSDYYDKMNTETKRKLKKLLIKSFIFNK